MAFLLAETVCNCLFPRLVGLLPRPCCCVLHGCPLNKINLQRSRLLLLLVFNAARSACALVFTPCRLFTRSQAWLGTYGVKPRPCCVPRSGTPGAAAPGRRCRRTALARARGAGVSQHGPERCRA